MFILPVSFKLSLSSGKNMSKVEPNENFHSIVVPEWNGKKGRLGNIHPSGLGHSGSLALCLQLENISLLLLVVSPSCWNHCWTTSQGGRDGTALWQGCTLWAPWPVWTSWCRRRRRCPWAPRHRCSVWFLSPPCSCSCLCGALLAWLMVSPV